MTKRYTHNPTAHDSVQLHHADAAGVSERVTRNYPETLLGTTSSQPDDIDPRQTELDPMGNNVGTVTGYNPQYLPSEPTFHIPIEGESPLFINGQRVSFSLDGMAISSQQAQALMGTLGGAYLMSVWTGPASGASLSLGNYRVRVQDGNQSHWNSFGNDLGAAVAAAGQYAGSEIFAHLYVDQPMFTGVWEPQGGVPAPLNDKERRKLEKAFAKVERKIASERCNRFLTKHLGGSITSKISETLKNQQAFSGPRSSGISTRDAGLYPPEELARLERLIEAGGRAAVSAEYEITRSVAQYFEDKSRDRKVGAAVGNYNGNPNTVFYRSFDSLSILHEALHVASRLNDEELARTLGIDVAQFNGDKDLASQAITQRLKENGCK